MFEDFDSINFEREDGNFYCDSVSEFKMLSTVMPFEEVGISFNDCLCLLCFHLQNYALNLK